ncbi:MAG: pyrimidine-nucleoside phosphorylase [Herpetosiphon sp.]
MNVTDLIIKKRDGGRLEAVELEFLIRGFVDGAIPDFQMAAWAMAVVWRGMDDRETADLTLAMAHSGSVLDLSGLHRTTVDKHSTGGVGDKTSLVLGPLCAAAGLSMAKMSGRGLGFTGGTLDKLESIPGLQVDLAPAEFKRVLGETGLVISGQTSDVAPADKLLYALRDVTGTVESIPLIASSIMSKKLAAGADCLVLDVKVGSGAFMKTQNDARELARRMVAIGEHAGRKVAAVLTTMEQPLGRAIGNAVEVREAIATLHGAGPADLRELCLVLGGQLAVLAGKARSADAGRHLMEQALDDGRAWTSFCRWIEAQGGDVNVLTDPQLLPEATIVEPVMAHADGYVAHIDALALGLVVRDLGGGRARREDIINAAVGVVLEHKVGDAVMQGTPLATIHADHRNLLADAQARVQQAIRLASTLPEPLPLVLEIVEHVRR